MVSHFSSKKPQKRRNAFRTSTEISCPSPVVCFQSAASATLLAARPIAPIVPNRMELGRTGSKGKTMAKQVGSAESVYKRVEVIGTSTKSWDDAAKNAVETAAGTLRDLRIAEVVKLDMKVEDGKIRAYRARAMLSFKYES